MAQASSLLTAEGVLICEVGNSLVHVEETYPEVDFQWLTFERGGHGVFALRKEQLDKFKSIFTERMIS